MDKIHHFMKKNHKHFNAECIKIAGENKGSGRFAVRGCLQADRK
jgi:hypothetical protein